MSFGRYKAGQKIKYVGRHPSTVTKRHIGLIGTVCKDQSANLNSINVILGGEERGVFKENIAPLEFTIDDDGNLG